MRLAELNPIFKSDRVLRFDCPCGQGHKLRVPIDQPTGRGDEIWRISGEFPSGVTVTPSVNAGCWHGNIINGEIK